MNTLIFDLCGSIVRIISIRETSPFISQVKHGPRPIGIQADGTNHLMVCVIEVDRKHEAQQPVQNRVSIVTFDRQKYFLIETNRIDES